MIITLLVLAAVFIVYDNGLSHIRNPIICNISCPGGYKQLCKKTWDCQPGPGCREVFFDYHFRNEMVYMHNYIRNEVAMGKTRLPSASDMRYLNYDKHLEYVSQCYVNNCQVNFTSCNKTSTFPGFMGQNFMIGRNLTKLSSRFVLNTWYSEIASLNATQLQHAPVNVSNNFTQVIWAETHRFGCALTQDTHGVQYLLCSYYPPIVYGKSAYKEGKSCLECHQCNMRFEGLCGGMITNVHSGSLRLDYNFVYLLWLFAIISYEFISYIVGLLSQNRIL